MTKWLKLVKELSKCEDIIGIYEYGSVTHLSSKEFYAKTPVVFDLLIISKDKSPRLKKIIDNVFSGFGTVIHHPDLYRPRIFDDIYIEIVVLPKKSNYLIRNGILLGLSGFVKGNFITRYGSDKIDKYLPLPTNPKTQIERYYIFRTCDNGIKYIQTMLWPLLNNNYYKSDIRRISKYFFMDTFWIFSGEFKKNWNYIRDNISKYFTPITKNKDFRKYFKYISSSKFDPHINNKMTTFFYCLIKEIDIKLKKIFYK